MCLKIYHIFFSVQQYDTSTVIIATDEMRLINLAQKKYFNLPIWKLIIQLKLLKNIII